MDIARPPTQHKIHPNSLKNLKPPYKKGENGHGRVYPLRERLYHALDKPLIEPGKNACAGDKLVYSTLVGAIKREPTPFGQVWDRVAGPVNKEAVRGDTTIQILVIDPDAQVMLRQVVAGERTLKLMPGEG